MEVSANSLDPDVPIPFEACSPSGMFVFVSYAHDDKAFVYPELLRIRSFGIRVWYDEGIDPGSEWADTIADALDGAAACVVMITPNAVASRNVRNEINAALKWGKPMFAVHLAQTELPKGLELQMGAVQAIMRWRLDESSYARKLGMTLASYATSPAPSHMARVLSYWIASSFNAVAFSPDGRLLATGSSDYEGPARLWDPGTGEQLRNLTGHFGPVEGVAFSPDGRLLATGGNDKTARLWDPATGEQLHTLTGHTGQIGAVAFSPDGRLLATVGREDHTARLWDPATGEQLRTLTGHTGSVEGVAFSPDGRLLVTAAASERSGMPPVRLWDAATGEHLGTLPAGVHGVAFSPDGRLLATTNYNTVLLWDHETQP